MRKTERRRKTKRRCRKQHRRTAKGGMIRSAAKSIFTNTADLGKEIVKDAIKREGFGGEYSNKMKNLNENVKPGIIENYSSENANPNIKSPNASPISENANPNIKSPSASPMSENAKPNIKSPSASPRMNLTMSPMTENAHIKKPFGERQSKPEDIKKLTDKILASNELFTPTKFKM